MPDAALYIVRPGDNEELRFSLRSLEAHYPDLPVFVVGDRPEWLSGVEFRQGNLGHIKQINVWQNLLLGAAWEDVPEDLLVMNDDFYFTGPTKLDPKYRCTLQEHWEHVEFRRDWWSRSIYNTGDYLNGLGIMDPLSYEVHTPFLVQKSAFHDVLADLPQAHGDPPQWRTAYGNIMHIGGTKFKDVKNYYGYEVTTLPEPFVSSADEAFFQLLPLLAARFPIPSRFETQYES